ETIVRASGNEDYFVESPPIKSIEASLDRNFIDRARLSGISLGNGIADKASKHHHIGHSNERPLQILRIAHIAHTEFIGGVRQQTCYAGLCRVQKGIKIAYTKPLTYQFSSDRGSYIASTTN